MDPKQTIYIGVDISSTGSVFYYVALDSKLALVTRANGQMGDVWEFAVQQPSALIASNTPARLNHGFMASPEMRGEFSLPKKSARWSNLRVGEYQLHLKGIHCPRTPSQIDDCPTWIQNSLIFYQVLHNKGFHPFSTMDSTHAWIEVNSEAAFQFILGHPLYGARTLEGRLQRQLLLFESGLNIHDPIECFEEITRHRLLHGQFPFDSIYSTHELQAICAAYMAWLVVNRPMQITKVGVFEEGHIYIPSQDSSS